MIKHKRFVYPFEQIIICLFYITMETHPQQNVQEINKRKSVDNFIISFKIVTIVLSRTDYVIRFPEV